MKVELREHVWLGRPSRPCPVRLTLPEASAIVALTASVHDVETGVVLRENEDVRGALDNETGMLTLSV